MSDAPDMRPMDWVEVAARAHEEGIRKGLEQAAQVAERRWRDWKEMEPGDCEVECDVTACADIAATLRAMKDKP